MKERKPPKHRSAEARALRAFAPRIIPDKRCKLYIHHGITAEELDDFLEEIKEVVETTDE